MKLRTSLAQIFAVPVTAIGILVSLGIGLATLRELRQDRSTRARPVLRFDQGGSAVQVELVDSDYVPGLNPKFVLPLTRERPKTANRLDCLSPLPELKNYGNGPALDTKITFLFYRVFIGNECFIIDQSKREAFTYLEGTNRIPAHPSHIQPGTSGLFFRLPTPIVVDYDRRITRLDCVVRIEYLDTMKEKHITHQALTFRPTIQIRKEQDGSERKQILLTFHEEVDDIVDSRFFGPPETPALSLIK